MINDKGENIRMGPQKENGHFRNSETIIRTIRYIHAHPHSGLQEIVKKCDLSHAGFYRLRKQAMEFLGVKIEFVKGDGGKGYFVFDYGLLDRKKL